MSEIEKQVEVKLLKSLDNSLRHSDFTLLSGKDF